MSAEGEGKGGVEGGSPRLCHKPFAPMGLCALSVFVALGRGVDSELSLWLGWQQLPEGC